MVSQVSVDPWSSLISSLLLSDLMLGGLHTQAESDSGFGVTRAL